MIISSPKLVVAILSICAVASVEAAEPVSYVRDIAPLFAEHCLQCHGPNETDRQADLRLDDAASASARRDNGTRVISPGEASASELIARVTSTDADLRMPPTEHGRQLTRHEVDLLRRWINDGADWAPHWAFIAPKRSALPSIRNRSWPRNAIDDYIAAEIESAGIDPSAEASRPMLARRAALTLTGLPPSPESLREFLADDAPDAYNRYLDKLLASPRYGEHMALAWLDLARYADTHGFHTDSHRDMWRWRDWVIDAYNNHMPLDRFIVEQVAGDLLPDATLSQRIATGFHRNHMINFENGAIAEEYRNLYIVDRVNTTATVFLGLTVACAQCHDHKYDPISQREYYQLYAFLNNVPEKGIDGSRGNAVPNIKAPTPRQQQELARLATEIAEAQKTIEERSALADELVARWESSQGDNPPAASPATGLTWHFSFDARGTGGGVALDSVSGKWSGKTKGNALFLPASRHDGGLLMTPGATIEIEKQTTLNPADGMTIALWVFPTTVDQMVAARLFDGDLWTIGIARGVPFAERRQADGTTKQFVADKVIRQNSWTFLTFRFSGTESNTGEIFIDGAAVETTTQRVELDSTEFTEETSLTIGSADAASFRGRLDEYRGYSRAISDEEIAELFGSTPIAEILRTPRQRRSVQQQAILRQHYLSRHDDAYRSATKSLRAATSRKEAIEREIPTSMVMQELPEPRETHLLIRGDYRRQGPLVERDTPSILHPWRADAPRNRLGLAQWLIDPANPLTARVIVNRQWMQIFGQPLVATPDDFGLRGSPPTHPALLDWLAVELIESGWNLQHLQRLMLLSATFRQTSAVSEERFATDPTNRWYARYQPVSLTGETLRDSSLAAAGLLGSDVGGRSVFPYQPPGLWEAVAYDPNQYTAQRYTQSQGTDLYRRSLYTFWKRSVPLPTLAAFGSPTRETCVVMRSQATTSQQALVIWNDPTYVEAARHIACRAMRAVDQDSTRACIEKLFLLMLSREPNDRELAAIEDLVLEQQDHFRSNPELADKLLTVGDSPVDETLSHADQAAWLIVAQTIMMTEEYMTRP